MRRVDHNCDVFGSLRPLPAAVRMESYVSRCEVCGARWLITCRSGGHNSAKQLRGSSRRWRRKMRRKT